MSTEGAFGWRVDGADKIGYNHFDSYPTGLGIDVLHFIKKLGSIEAVRAFAEEVKLVDDDEADVFDGRTFQKEFYDRSSFMHDSLICEWAYIVNADTEMLEVYKGFNHNPKAEGRYILPAKETSLHSGDKYYGVALVKEIPLKDVFDGKVERFSLKDEKSFEDLAELSSKD